MKLAVFDMDGTLLSVDAGVEWIHYLNRHSGVDLTWAVRQCQRHFSDYHSGCFNVEQFMNFHMAVLSQFPRRFLLLLRDAFIKEVIAPNIGKAAQNLVSAMRSDGYVLVLATGTQRFISEPIAQLFGIENVLATTPLLTQSGEFSGKHLKDFCYGPSKIDRIEDFLKAHHQRVDMLESFVFYTDSITDWPLIQFVEENHGHVIATNPDPRLKEQAEQRGWSIIEIFHR